MMRTLVTSVTIIHAIDYVGLAPDGTLTPR